MKHNSPTYQAKLTAHIQTSIYLIELVISITKILLNYSLAKIKSEQSNVCCSNFYLYDRICFFRVQYIFIRH